MSRRIKSKKANSSEDSVHRDIPDYDMNMYDHLKPENVAAEKKAINQLGKNSGLTKIKAFLIVTVIIVALAFGGAFTGDLGRNNNNDDSQIINTNNGGLATIPLKDQWLDEHSEIGVNFHFFLSFIIFDQTEDISAEVGIYGSRMKPMHTHDDSGMVHVELPTDNKLTPTLGDLFAIWSEWAEETIELSRYRLMGEYGDVLLTSNGNFVITGDPASYQLRDYSDEGEVLVLSVD